MVMILSASFRAYSQHAVILVEADHSPRFFAYFFINGKSMKINHETESYLIESTASANSIYFETDALAKMFFRYCNYYLKDYLKVEEYVLNEHGWSMLVKVRSVQTIRNHYDIVVSERKSLGKESKSKKAKEIWWILSERVRLFISTYVRMSNKILGREGSLVRRKYGRYEFDSLETAQAYIATIRNDRHDIKQPKEEYRGNVEHFRMSGDILTNPLRSSLWMELCTVKEGIEEKLDEIFGGEMPVMHGLGNLVTLKSKLVKTVKNILPTTHPNPN